MGMSVAPPDYSTYTIAELRTALQNVDKQTDPERAREIEQHLIDAEARQRQTQDEAELDEINDIEHFTVARRRERFAAAIIDALVSILAAIPFWIVANPLLEQLGLTSPQSGFLALFQSFLLGLCYGVLMFLLINGYLIATRAQTIGKHFLHIQVQTLEGRPATFSRYVFKRHLPMLLAYSLPVLGAVIALADILFIAGKPRRCLHDYVAGTRVGYISS
ncbi:RDD family protein [Salinimonas marina]|uniref:RDD family protein n=1 Tax=Salinimonas marina TaxID=2785918 RepID=A0A7S9HD73_9ALTE|nr:RDD family protein [Salinimonas marina]QPG05824.1 RDD family protein [Salinimonas marina]